MRIEELEELGKRLHDATWGDPTMREATAALDELRAVAAKAGNDVFAQIIMDLAVQAQNLRLSPRVACDIAYSAGRMLIRSELAACD